MRATLSPEAQERLKAFYGSRLADKEAKLVLAEEALAQSDEASRWKRLSSVSKLKRTVAELRALLADN